MRKINKIVFDFPSVKYISSKVCAGRGLKPVRVRISVIKQVLVVKQIFALRGPYLRKHLYVSFRPSLPVLGTKTTYFI